MAAALLALLLAASTATGAGDPVVATLEIEIRVESEALAADLAEHGAARQREVQELRRVLDLSARIDRRLTEDPPALADLVRLEEDLHNARDAAAAAGDRSREVRQRIYQRWQRIAALREALLAHRGAGEDVTDPLSGRWSLVLMPSGQRGTMELRLDGTLVQGSYRLDGGFAGSMRGTLVAGKVTLERIDGERGFDAVFEGRLDAANGRLTGGWRTTRLDGANYGGGDWSAQRLQESSTE